MINEILFDFVGYTQKEKVVMDATKILLENKAKALGYLPKPAEVSLVIASENGEIKSIGGSVPNDLINNNWGIMFAAWFRSTTPGGGTIISLDDDGGVARTIKIGTSVGPGAWNNATGGSRFQVGQGSTVAARSDLAIETPFANAGPEDSLENTGVGGWNPGLGQGTIVALIGPTAGSGTVTETVDMWFFSDQVPSGHNFLMAHDIISPGVAFVIAQTLTVTYVWQM